MSFAAEGDVFEKAGTGCNNTERVSTVWLCACSSRGLEAERAFNVSWLLKNKNTYLPSSKETHTRNTDQNNRKTMAELGALPTSLSSMQTSISPESSEWQIQLQTGASSASA